MRRIVVNSTPLIALSAIKPSIDGLINNSIYIDKKLYYTVLRECNES
jgi:hypothetical protein